MQRDAPPAPPPEFLSQTVRNKVVPQKNLPMLNWTPMFTTQLTMFEVSFQTYFVDFTSYSINNGHWTVVVVVVVAITVYSICYSCMYNNSNR